MDASPVEVPVVPHDRYRPVPFVIAALAIVFVAYQVVGGVITLLLLGFRMDAENVALMRVTTLLAQALLLLGPTLYLWRLQHGSLRLPLRRPSLQEFVLAVVGVVALLEFLQGYLALQDMIPLPESVRPLVEEVRKMIEETERVLVHAGSPMELLGVLAVVALTPAICEETLFRGLVQRNLAAASTPVTGYVVTGVVFGLYHFNPFLAVPLVVLGIFFGFLMHRSRSLFIPMAAHFTNNCISVLAEYAGDKGNHSGALAMLTDQSALSIPTLLGSMLFFGAIVVIVVALYVRATPADRIDPEGGAHAL